MPPLASCRLPRRTSSAFLRLLHSSPKADVPPRACHLESRSVVAFTGTDTFKFLQGLLTNDVRRLSGSPSDGSSSSSSSPHFPALYAARLTPQGRFLYDMVLYRPPKEGPVEGGGLTGFELVADVDSSDIDEILSCLKRYRLRANVEVEDVTEDFSCWQYFGGNLGDDLSEQGLESGTSGLGSGIDFPGASSAQRSNHGWQWFKDPRLASLGFRGIFPAGSMPPLVEADKRTGEENYLLWRLKKGVAEGSLEIPKWESIPLEYNLVGLNAISFDKGCYVGQEFIARTHHRGVIRKRLFPLKFTNGLHEDLEKIVAPGSEVVDSSNKKVGTVSRAHGSCGIGVLRLDDAFNSPSLSIKDQKEIKVKPIKPNWWPPEWTRDIEQQNAAAVGDAV